MQIKSARSRISLADIVSRPVAFDLLSLVVTENTWSLMLRYSRQLLSPLAANGISLASFGPIVEKCSLNVFVKSVVLFIEIPFTISSLIEEMLLQFVCSWPGAARVVFVFSKWLFVIRFLQFAILMLLLTLMRSRLNSPQSCGLFERIAFKSEVIQGIFLNRPALFLKEHECWQHLRT